MKKIFAGVAGTMLLGAGMLAAQEPNAPPKAPELVKNTASVTATDTGLSVSASHSACMADGHSITVNINGGVSLAKPVTAEQAAALQKAWETGVEPALDADLDPFVRGITVADIVRGDVQKTTAGLPMSDEEASAHAQALETALMVFQMQATQIIDGNQPDGMGGSLGAGYSISKAPVAACTFQPAAPASAPK